MDSKSAQVNFFFSNEYDFENVWSLPFGNTLRGRRLSAGFVPLRYSRECDFLGCSDEVAPFTHPCSEVWREFLKASDS